MLCKKRTYSGDRSQIVAILQSTWLSHKTSHWKSLCNLLRCLRCRIRLAILRRPTLRDGIRASCPVQCWSEKVAPKTDQVPTFTRCLVNKRHYENMSRRRRRRRCCFFSIELFSDVGGALCFFYFTNTIVTRLSNSPFCP